VWCNPPGLPIVAVAPIDVGENRTGVQLLQGRCKDPAIQLLFRQVFNPICVRSRQPKNNYSERRQTAELKAELRVFASWNWVLEAYTATRTGPYYLHASGQPASHLNCQKKHTVIGTKTRELQSTERMVAKPKGTGREKHLNENKNNNRHNSKTMRFQNSKNCLHLSNPPHLPLNSTLNVTHTALNAYLSLTQIDFSSSIPSIQLSRPKARLLGH
jgi:hypothetical protein